MAEPEAPAARGQGRIVTVIGATGFLGRRIVRRLEGHGLRVRAASRHPKQAGRLFADLPRVEAVDADIHAERSLGHALEGTYAAVNAVSLYAERGRVTFEAVHVEGAARLARLAREHGLKRLVQVSGIGADPQSSSAYIRARGRGEIAVGRAFPGAVLTRPSVMFGPDDAFLTRIVRLVRSLPVFPLFGKGETLLQPVSVEDVGEAIACIVIAEGNAARPFHEFGGPDVFTYRELVQTVAELMDRRARTVSVPFSWWNVLARLPGAPLTRDQVALMERDNVASGSLPGLFELGLEPTPIDGVVTAINQR